MLLLQEMNDTLQTPVKIKVTETHIDSEVIISLKFSLLSSLSGHMRVLRCLYRVWRIDMDLSDIRRKKGRTELTLPRRVLGQVN